MVSGLFSRKLVALLWVMTLACSGVASAQFNYSVYDGQWDALPDFTALTPIATGTSNTIGVSVTGQTETFGLVFTRQLTVATSATFEFSTTSDDGSRLYIDNNLVVDNDGLHAAATVTGSIALAAGSYDLRVEFFEKFGGQTLDVAYRAGGAAFSPIPANGQLVAPLKSEVGEWSAVISWPEIAISAANMPDGRVLTWSSTETNAFPSSTEFTHASVFDPQTLAFQTVDSNFHDMFCAGIAMLEDGRVVASGGNPDDDKVSFFEPNTLTWGSLSNMFDRRWYATSVALPGNEIWSTFGKSAGNRSERYDPASNSWTSTPNASMQTLLDEQNSINAAANPTGALNLEWWAHMAMTPQGKVFQGGPAPSWHLFDPIAGTATQPLGQLAGTRARMYGNAVSYDVGKVMLLGGADRRESAPTTTANVYLVDLNGPTPVVTTGPAMHHARAVLNSVTLPNGEVLAIGGNTSGKIFSDEGSVFAAEVYDPIANDWTELASMSVPRNYHSTALLLKDGRVLSAGGGACGGCSANHMDGQIFSPPYLFDVAGNPAARPTLANTPNQVQPGDQVIVTASADTQRFTMVRLSGTTHHMNTDQRFVPVVASDNGDGTWTLDFNSNPNVLLMGYYWLFAVNANGTPSIGEAIQVLHSSAPPSGSDVYISDLPWSSQSNSWGPVERDMSNGEAAAGDGNPITLNGITYTKGVGVHASSEIVVNLAGNYDRFLSDIGLDDERDGLSGSVSFEVRVDGVTRFSSGVFTDTTPTQSVDVDVSGANQLTLVVSAAGDGIAGDHADWAGARLSLPVIDGYRFYRFTPTQLRDDAGVNSVQLSELAFSYQGGRVFASAVANPGGSNPAAETAPNADDNNVLTKWLDFNKGALVYDYGANVLIDAYQFATANDVPGRDPVRWTLEGSTDNINWVLIDDQTSDDYATPLARNTYIGDIAVDLGFGLDVITPLPAAPRSSTTLIVENSVGNDRIWNVNPDNDSVSVIDNAGTLLQQISVGDRPWSLAKDPAGARVFVVNKGDASISVIDSASFSVLSTVALPDASQPHGLVFSGDGSTYYVVLEALARIEKRDASSHAVLASAVLGGSPRHLGIRYDDARLYVSNFITPPLAGEDGLSVDINSGGGEVFVLDTTSLAQLSTITLPYDSRALSESQGPGLPNYLHAPVISFDDLFAYVPSKKDNVDSGPLRQKPGMTFEFTVRANSSKLDLASDTEDAGFRVDHDNAGMATGAALTGDNRYLLVALETSREVAVYDTVNGFELMRLSVGRAPQAVALSTDGSVVYVHNFMDRSVSRIDITDMLQQHLPLVTPLPTVNVVTVEALTAQVLNGKQLFYDAEDDRLARDNYISCASCHNDGAQDGRTWDLGGMGEGVRNTISLRGRGVGHGMIHWTGNFDEIQDFENQIRSLAAGTGLMSEPDFLATSDPLGAPKATLSADLDAMAAYVASLTQLEASPHRPSAVAMSAPAQTGQQLFVDRGCIGCHAPAPLSDSASALLHDVGTIVTASGDRLGQPLAGFDTPGLVGAWQYPPYLHNGSAATLELAVQSHASGASLTGAEVNNLAQFLREAQVADASVMVDSDGDGTFDFADPAIGDPCVPLVFVAACPLDSDGDGVSDFNEGELVDSDGDGLFDYQESSLLDSDNDTVPDQQDVDNNNACVPHPIFCQQNVPMLGLWWLHALMATGLLLIVKSSRASGRPR